MPAAIIFDVDGTLIDSNDFHAEAFVEAFRQKNQPIAFDHVRWLIGMGSDKLIPELLGSQASPELVESIGNLKKQIFQAKYQSQLEAFPKTLELLSRLKTRGFMLSIASSAEREELEQMLKIAALDHLFESVTCSSDADRSKPDPDIVQAALKKIGMSVEQVFMIGDTPYDLTAAQRAGISAVAFRSGGWSDSDLNTAKEIYDGCADMLWRLDQSNLINRGLGY